ncbi:probable glutamate receptor [Parasteatoda tepidariorum]|uniref:probable glutamate receptor n=1 Tax=Parasteatoda tepidariorum TaxID=114398 RepID=UPI001C71DC19|nr:probable glutamate receptor [Parasteatoda tepidariorum]
MTFQKMVAYFPSKLRIAVLPNLKALEIKRINYTTIISGVEAEFLKLLSHKLNFEYEILAPSDNSYGFKDTFGNWTGIVGMLQRNEADMAISLIGITEERSSVVDFSLPYLYLEKTFMMNHAAFLPKTSAFLYPFSTFTWILFWIALLFVTVLFRALISPQNSIITVFLKLWGSSFGQGMNYNPRSMSRRIPLGIWLVYSYVLILCYSSVLLSFLTSPIRMKQIKDFKDLYTAIREGKMECRAEIRTLEADYLSKSNIPHFKGLGEYIKRNEWYFQSRVNATVPENVAVLGSPFLFSMAFGSPEMYFYSKDVFGNFPFGVAIRKDFCCKEHFNTILLRILSGGLYNKLMDNFLFKFEVLKKLNFDHSQRTSASVLKLSDLSGVFVILGIGWTAGIFALIMEIAYNRWLR